MVEVVRRRGGNVVSVVRAARVSRGVVTGMTRGMMRVARVVTGAPLPTMCPTEAPAAAGAGCGGCESIESGKIGECCGSGARGETIRSSEYRSSRCSGATAALAEVSIGSGTAMSAAIAHGRGAGSSR